MTVEDKIVVKNPVVELDGDEMTRIIWKKIREEVWILHSIVQRLKRPNIASSSSFFLMFNWISSISIWALRLGMP
jgi:isocitrate dehydrogenase